MGKLLVISSDAMVGEDLEYFKTLPNYKKYLSGGAEITNISSIYPSVTFPAHVTMMTGLYPDRHGVFSNMQMLPGSDPTPWQWGYERIHGTDIFRVAKAAGKTTAAVFWPVTAQNPAIDYHIADYWTQGDGETNEKRLQEREPVKKYLKSFGKMSIYLRGWSVSIRKEMSLALLARRILSVGFNLICCWYIRQI